MKKPPSKKQIRSDIERQVDDFLARGGSVARIERGVSGHLSPGGQLSMSGRLFQEPRSARTPLNDVVTQLESRRKPAAAPVTATRGRKPRKIPLYDDFGEIIRWVWEE